MDGAALTQNRFNLVNTLSYRRLEALVPSLGVECQMPGVGFRIRIPYKDKGVHCSFPGPNHF